MEYFNLLEFKKEPFSNSPEPEFLFASPQHNTCLQMLELAVRLRRGLNIVIGPVGTGKTTLCRKLIQNLSAPAVGDSPAVDTFLLLDPAVSNRLEFVKTVAGILGIMSISTDANEWQIKEKIKSFLFDKGVQEQKVVVLVIDEGQKIPDDCLEILREFLNYETNSFKLLQIVIFAQPELRKSLASRVNLLDRVNYLHDLKSFSFPQMKAMIEHRISVASQSPAHHHIFTFGGLLAVYLETAGYPRKIVSLCHQVMLKLIISGKNKASWFLVRSCTSKMAAPLVRRVTWATLSILALAILALSATFYLAGKTAAVTKTQTQQQRTLSGIDINKEVSVSSAEKAAVNKNVKMPEYFGTMPLTKRMTIWWVLENIYGDSGAEMERRFILANPQIKDINETMEGNVIHVPLIPEQSQPLKKDTIIVALGKSKDLANIYYSFIQKKDMDNMPAMLFLAFWNKHEGKQFTIALDKRFTNIEEAKDAIGRLPSELAASAQVLSQWDGDTVFFNHKFSSN